MWPGRHGNQGAFLAGQPTILAGQDATLTGPDAILAGRDRVLAGQNVILGRQNAVLAGQDAILSLSKGISKGIVMFLKILETPRGWFLGTFRARVLKINPPFGDRQG